MSGIVLSGDTSGTVALNAPTVAGTQSYTLPTAVPAANGYALTSTTAGVMSWAAASGGTPGGSNTQIQFNNSSAFGGSANFTWDGTNAQLGATGALRFADSDSSNYVAFKSAATVASNVTWTLPATDGTAGQVLSTNGSGILSWVTVTASPSAPSTVEYLVVGGGGGGAGELSTNAGGGGGGAGGFRTNASFSVASGTAYTVTVGGGGNGGAAGQNSGAVGSSSVFSSITSAGGGFGSSRTTGGNGGSGGGGGLDITGGTGNTPSTSPSQGNNGGGGTSAQSAGAGGGGATAAGTGALTSVAGNGGAGTASSITGASVTYAGGGGGGGLTGGTGGAGGGGTGAQGSAAGNPGTANTGGGGGAAYDQSTSGKAGGAGGSGVVIIAYPDTFAAPTSISGGLIYTQPTRAGYRVYRFTAGTGTITW